MQEAKHCTVASVRDDDKIAVPSASFCYNDCSIVKEREGLEGAFFKIIESTFSHNSPMCESIESDFAFVETATLQKTKDGEMTVTTS